jgi:hypothetical protein
VGARLSRSGPSSRSDCSTASRRPSALMTRWTWRPPHERSQ